MTAQSLFASNAPEILESLVPLIGPAPAGVKFGIDQINMVLYTVDSLTGDWKEYSASGSMVIDLDASAAASNYDLGTFTQDKIVHLNVFDKTNGGLITSADPIVGLTDISACENGDQLLAISELITPILTIAGTELATWTIVAADIELVRASGGVGFTNAFGAIEWSIDGGNTYGAWGATVGGSGAFNVINTDPIFVRNTVTSTVAEIDFITWAGGGGIGPFTGNAFIAGNPTNGWRVLKIKDASDIDENIFSTDLASSGSRDHTIIGQDLITFSTENGAGSSTYELEIGENRLAADTRGYDEDQTTQVTRTHLEVESGALTIDLEGNSKIVLNGDSGMPRERISSDGWFGNNNPTSYQNPSIIKVDSIVDFTTAEPALNDTANANLYFWNDTAGVGSGSGTAYTVGLYAYQVEPTGFLLNPYYLEPQTGVIAVEINDEIFNVDTDNTLVPFSSGAWNFRDFAVDTLSDGEADKVYRFLSSATAPRTLTIDTALYQSGSRMVIQNDNDTHDVMVGLTAGAQFATSEGTVNLLTLAPGEVYTLVRNSGPFWSITSVYPSKAGISTDAGQELILGSDGLPLLQVCDSYPNQSIGAYSNGSPQALEDFTPANTGDYDFTFSAEGFAPAAGNAFINIGTAGISSDDVFTSTGNRVDATTPTQTYTVSLVAGTTYNITARAGGGSSVTDASLVAKQINCLDIPDSETCGELAQITATAENTNGQPGGNGLFKMDFVPAFEANEYVSYDTATGIASGQAPFDITLTASFVTAGSGNTAPRSYHFRNLLNGDAVGDVSGTSGVFGQGTTQTPAEITIPKDTAFSYDIRSASSAQNQRLQAGSFLKVDVCGDLQGLFTDYLEYGRSGSTTVVIPPVRDITDWDVETTVGLVQANSTNGIIANSPAGFSPFARGEIEQWGQNGYTIQTIHERDNGNTGTINRFALRTLISGVVQNAANGDNGWRVFEGDSPELLQKFSREFTGSTQVLTPVIEDINTLQSVALEDASATSSGYYSAFSTTGSIGGNQIYNLRFAIDATATATTLIRPFGANNSDIVFQVTDGQVLSVGANAEMLSHYVDDYVVDMTFRVSGSPSSFRIFPAYSAVGTTTSNASLVNKVHLLDFDLNSTEPASSGANIQSGTTPDPGGAGGTLRTVTFPTAFATVPNVTANAMNVPAGTGGMVVNIVNITTTTFAYTIKRVADNADHGQWHQLSWIAVE